MNVPGIDVEQFAVRLATATPPLVLDVREDWERQLAALPGTLNIPMNDVPERLDRLREEQANSELVVICRSGARSAQIIRFLQQNGFVRVFNLNGGLNAYAREIDSSIPLY